MYCSHCEVCCERTEMLLSNADVERLERMGYNRLKFVRFDKHGFVRLRNRRGFCVFMMLIDVVAEFINADLWDVEFIQ